MYWQRLSINDIIVIYTGFDKSGAWLDMCKSIKEIGLAYNFLVMFL